MVDTPSFDVAETPQQQRGVYSPRTLVPPPRTSTIPRSFATSKPLPPVTETPALRFRKHRIKRSGRSATSKINGQYKMNVEYSSNREYMETRRPATTDLAPILPKDAEPLNPITQPYTQPLYTKPASRRCRLTKAHWLLIVFLLAGTGFTIYWVLRTQPSSSSSTTTSPSFNESTGMNHGEGWTVFEDEEGEGSVNVNVVGLEVCEDVEEQRYRFAVMGEEGSLLSYNQRVVGMQNIGTWECFIGGAGPPLMRNATGNEKCIIEGPSETPAFVTSNTTLELMNTESRRPCGTEEFHLGWKYDYLPSSTLPAKNVGSALKLGNGKCLGQTSNEGYEMADCVEDDGQIFRRALGGSKALAFENVKYYVALGVTFGWESLKNHFYHLKNHYAPTPPSPTLMGNRLLYPSTSSSPSPPTLPTSTTTTAPTLPSSSPTPTLQPLGTIDPLFRIISGDGRCLEQRGDAIELGTCGTQEAQRFGRRMIKDTKNGPAKRRRVGVEVRNPTSNVWELTTNTTLTIRIKELTNNYELLCLSSVDLYFGPCLMNEAQLNWRYDYVPTEIIPQKDHYFRLKSGTGQCLQQLAEFRMFGNMAVIGTETDSLGRVGLSPTSLAGSYLVFEDGLMRDRFPARRGLWCLTSSLTIETRRSPGVWITCEDGKNEM
ncbi:hypothetical protein BC829DRAFT_417658 [Chytridium lagenaria]|nr:hypothetical protein BC829DRAFT_417658 [Chytridium lagenaria]